jgi:hypothetical protein
MFVPLRHLFFRQVKRFFCNINMEEPQKTNDSPDVDTYLSLSTQPDVKYRPKPDPLSVYVPLDALTRETVYSIVSTVLHSEKRDWNHSKRTLLAFLLALNEKINDIEQNKDTNDKFDESTIKHAIEVRQWFPQDLDWNELRGRYDEMASETTDGISKHYGVEKCEPYYELAINGVSYSMFIEQVSILFIFILLIIIQLHPHVIQSREYMARFRSHGWEPKELKVYWNAKQLENLCPKDEQTDDKDISPPHDPSDSDVVRALRECPVSKRDHAGEITYVNKGIEKAVFDVPEEAQIIVLNFAVSYFFHLSFSIASHYCRMNDLPEVAI